MARNLQVLAWYLAVLLPCLLCLPSMDDLDADIVDSIFGTGLDSARYGAVGEEWEEIPVTLVPIEDDCKPMQSPRDDPDFMEHHEELKQIEIIKENGDRKCDYYKETQGFECVPYYQCGEDGSIITDGYGLIDIRFGELAILDSTDLMCPGSMDICCKNPDFETTTAAPIEISTGGYGPPDEDDDSSEESEEESPDGKTGDNEGGYGGEEGGYGGEEGGYGGEDGEGRDDSVCVGDCPNENLEKYIPKCGRRNNFGLGVRIQNYEDGESQFGEWPHICAVTMLEEKSTGYGATEEVKKFVGGASLIAPGVLLTAAHKVADFKGDPSKLLVRCGEWDTQTSSEPLPHQDRQVTDVVLHPDYNPRNLANTAALLFIEPDFDLGQHIDTICLPEIDEVFDEESECFVKGWGKDKWEEGDFQVVLKEVALPMVPVAECLTALQKTRLGKRFRLDPSFVCAGGEEGKDACRGDGGGPLVCPRKDDRTRYVQVGIVAWGIGCGEARPAVYTSVASIGCWIDYVLSCRDFSHQFRYGTECQAWMDERDSRQNNDSKGRSACSVIWPKKDRDVHDGYGALPVVEQTIPEKIQIEKSVIGGY